MNILIFGGTGSLGYELVKNFYNKYSIWNYSRDECKQWQMKFTYPKVNHIIGDIGNKDNVSKSIRRVNPDIIIVAAAMKHIDKCELQMEESIRINIQGIRNVLDTVENYDILKVRKVLFVSTDKACSPLNVYGMCKSLAEKSVIERSMYVKKCDFICVRYGNVLNSRGSIIPVLKSIGEDKSKDSYFITHPEMTRFIMTIEQSVKLIEYALDNAKTGEIVIPKLMSMKIIDLINIFAKKYGKKIVTGSIRLGEKIDEALINTMEMMKTRDLGEYYHITPNTFTKEFERERGQYDSSHNNLKLEELKDYLEKIGTV